MLNIEVYYDDVMVSYHAAICNAMILISFGVVVTLHFALPQITVIQTNTEMILMRLRSFRRLEKLIKSYLTRN